jgi:hypothetical protein
MWSLAESIEIAVIRSLKQMYLIQSINISSEKGVLLTFNRRNHLSRKNCINCDVEKEDIKGETRRVGKLSFCATGKVPGLIPPFRPRFYESKRR